MRCKEQRIFTIRTRAALGLLVAGTACQLALDTDYTFDGHDAGTALGNLDPLPPLDSGADAGPSIGRVTDGGAADAPPLDGIDSGQMEPDEMEPEPEPRPPQTEPELPPDPDSGCSLVVYCRAHERLDTTAEELCRQLGCSLDEAIAECRAEMPLASVCGPNSAPPYTIIALSGDEVVFN